MDNSMTTATNAGRGHLPGRSRHRLVSAICLTALGLGALVATGPVEAAPALPATTTPSASVQLTFICKATFAGVTQQTGTTVAVGQYVFRVSHLSGTSPVSYRVAISNNTPAASGTIRTGEVQFVTAPQGGGYTLQPTSNWRNTSGGTASTNETQLCTQLPDPVVNSQQLRAAVQNKGGIINVAAGTYDLTTELEFRRDGTELRAVAGATPTIRYQGPSTSSSRVAEVFAKNIVIDGFVITGGNNPTDDGGAGIEVESGASLTIRRSWITGNRDDRGAGILNQGTITIVDSTISDNVASYKGGGLLNEGTATVTNSTIGRNTSLWGSAIASFSTINLNHTTIVRNVTTSNDTSYAALQRLSGNFIVRNSVIGDNMRSTAAAARNCAGTVQLLDKNLVSSSDGCPSPATGTIIAALLVGDVTDNGGPTPTAALLAGSPAIDQVDVTGVVPSLKCASNVTTDQRGTIRPAGAKCDLGGFELVALELADPTLGVDTAAYAGLDDRTVEVGATSVPSNLIGGQFVSDAKVNEADGTLDSARLRSIRLRSIRLRSIELQDIRLRSIAPPDPTLVGDQKIEAARLRSIDLKANGLRSIALESIRLRSIDLEDARLRSIDLADTRLRSIPLSDIPLTEVPGGWEAFLATAEVEVVDNSTEPPTITTTIPFANVPLQSLTLADIESVLPANFSLASIDLSSTRLRSIRLRSILLEGTRLRSIPLSDQLIAPSPANDLEWCKALLGATACIADPALAGAVGNVELWEAQLAGADVDQPSVLGVPLSGLTSTRLRSINGGTPAPADIEDARLRSIRLRSIFLENTALSAIRLSDIRLRSIAGDVINLDSIIDCSKNSALCNDPNTTLGQVVAGCLPEGVPAESGSVDPPTCLLRDPFFGQLLDLLGVEIDGVSLLDGVTLEDIQLAFTPPEDIPWESVNLQEASLQNIATPAQPTFHYEVDVQIKQGPATVTVDLRLPQGFTIAGGANPEAATFCSTTPAPCQNFGAPTATNDTTTTYVIPGVGSGSYKLRVPVRAGSIVGGEEQFQASATVTATGPNGTSTKDTNAVGVNVKQAGTATPKAPSLRDGQLELGYIGGSGELDVYSFVAPAGSTGASARVLLSNIPANVDYDLAVYGPRPVSLRGAPLPERAAIGDDRFDLDPGDDVLPTDIVDDIALDITKIAPTVGLTLPTESNGYALRDISSSRSNTDEEVTLPALVTGKTYVVVVSGYFGDVSAEPYGLRVRLDRRTAVPECPPSNYPGPSSLPVVNGLAVTAGTNTLYVTNAARLDHEAAALSPETGDPLPTSTDVLAAIAATNGVNGVNAGLLLLDDLAEWTAYKANGCDPDVRNVLAKAIGQRIDAANVAAGGSIQNIVIVGGDGVVPMAAVPDLAEYSNESTFALSVLDANGEGTPIAGAQASGFFLSDDPYATDAGISILGGDHELYVPDRNIGRLVETTKEIVDQLGNFVEYGGKVDPRSFDAAVTGYDFLEDGAQAVIEELSPQYPILESLLGDQWAREDYLDLFRDTAVRPKRDLSVFSPNAHYDFEALLPALPDTVGVYDDTDLVSTSDFLPGSTAGVTAPVRALGFTVGCHAGLNVSDVQVGPTLDWAQLYSQNQTQWVGHTTYGYGDTEIVAYSERLATLFAGNVASMTGEEPAAPTSLGAAVRDAKQRYLASTLVISPYDEKILQSWTYYGLPMYSIGEPPPPPPAPMAETVPTETQQPQGFRAAAGLSALTSGPVRFGTPVNGKVPVSIDVSAQLAAPTFTDLVEGSYYTIDDSKIVVQNRPVQPLVDVAIEDSGRDQFGGFLVTGLVSRDLPATYVPFVSRPLIDNSIDEPRFLAGDVAFPANLQQVTNIGDSQRLLVAAGQWQNGQRLFDKMSGELLPRQPGSDDVQAPRFLDVTGTSIEDVGTSGRGIRFDVRTEADATRVVILFRQIGTPNWRTLELSRSNGAWFGVAGLLASGGENAEFFAQSVDANGNVGITSNKIENFLSVEDEVVAPGEAVTATITPAPDTNVAEGRYLGDGGQFLIQPSAVTTDPATFSIGTGDPLPVGPGGITIDVLPAGDPLTYDNGLLGLAPGDYVITARFGDGPATNRFFTVDGSAPDVTYSRDLSLWTDPTRSALEVSATDPAGVARLTATVTVTEGGVQTVLSETEGTDDEGVITALVPWVEVAEGSSARPTLTVTVEDSLGNNKTLTSTLLVDNAKPIVQISPKSELWTNQAVTVTVTASDPDAGLATVILCNANVCAPIDLADGEYTDTIDANGVTSLTVTATDTAGNEASDSTDVRVDTIKPTGTIAFTTAPNGSGWYTGPVTATITASDSGGPSSSRIASVCVQRGTACDELTAGVDGTYTADVTEPQGVKEITVNITDTAGNTTTVTSSTIKVDTLKPTGTIAFTTAPNSSGWYTGTVTATITANDPGGIEASGIASVCVTGKAACEALNLNGNYQVDVTEPQGVKEITVNITDTAGNTTTVTSSTIKVDTLKPTGSIAFTTAPNSSGWYTGTVTATITATDPGGTSASGIDKVCVRRGTACDVLTAELDGSYRTGVTVPASADGTPSISVEITDKAGNVTPITAGPIQVDNKAPAITLGSTQVGAWTNTAVTVTATANDGTGSGLASLCLDTICDAATPKTLVIDPAVGAFVARYVSAKATDNVGLSTDATPITVRIDKALPTATLTLSGTRIYNVGEVATATFSCGDVGSGVALCELFDGTRRVSTTPGTPFTIDTSIAGSKSLRVQATDAAGNLSPTAATATATIRLGTCVLSTSRQSILLPTYTLRFTLCDAAGVNQSSPSITLTALTINGTRDPIVNFSGLSLTYRATYNTAGRFYEYTFFTGGLPGNVNHTLSFTTQPVPSRNIGTAALNALTTNTATFRLR